MKKKVLALVLAVLMVCSLLPTMALADAPRTWQEGRYVEVEYVESHGKEYIDTGLYPTATTKSIVTYQFTDFDTTATTAPTSSGVFGVFNGSPSSGTDSRYQIIFVVSDDEVTLGIGKGNAKVGKDTGKHTAVLDNNTVKPYFDGEELESTNGAAFTSVAGSDNSITLFAANQSIVKTGLVRLYSVKIYEAIEETETLIRDFVPVHDTTDNVYGMYDVQNNQFYGNDGTGAFTGPESESDMTYTVTISETEWKSNASSFTADVVATKTEAADIGYFEFKVDVPTGLTLTGITSGLSNYTPAVNLATGHASFVLNDDSPVNVDSTGTTIATLTFTMDTANATSGETATVGFSSGLFVYANDDDEIDAELVSDDVTLKIVHEFSDSAEHATVTPVSGVTDGTPKTVIEGEDVTFTVAPAENYIITGVSYSVDGGTAIPLTAGEGGIYTIPGSDITGDITLTVTTTDILDWEFISKEDYLALESGTQVAILKTDKLDGATYALTGYDDMFWSEKYEGYVYIVADTENDASLTGKLTNKDGTATVELGYTGDVNGKNGVSGADALAITQTLNDIEVTYEITVKMRLEMDVTGDKSVTATDTVWILYEVAGLSHE